MKPIIITARIDRPLRWLACLVAYSGAVILIVQAVEELIATGRLASSGKAEVLSPFEVATFLGWLSCVAVTTFPLIKYSKEPPQ